MPLVGNLPAAMSEDYASAVQVQLEAEHPDVGFLADDEGEENGRDSGYEDFETLDEKAEESKMEASVHRRRPEKLADAPSIPQRSDKRATKALENVLLELKSLDGTLAAKKDAEEQSVVNDPHEFYWSSEEDASLADDYDDTESLEDFAASPTEDGDGSEASSRASSRHSQEDTARVVSFTIVTKPQIIQINILPTAAQKRHSMNFEALTSSFSTSYIGPRRPTPLNLYPSSTGYVSISSNAASLTQHSNHSLISLPSRKTSKLSSLSNFMTTAKHPYQASDHFANDSFPREDEQETPVSPKTPTSMAASAWKKTLSKGLSMARKPSMPKLSLAYTAGVVTQRDPKLAMMLAAEETRQLDKDTEQMWQVRRSQTMPMQTIGEGEKEKVCDEDIAKAAMEAIKVPPIPASPVKERKMSMGWGLARRKSVKGRGDRYTG